MTRERAAGIFPDMDTMGRRAHVGTRTHTHHTCPYNSVEKADLNELHDEVIAVCVFEVLVELDDVRVVQVLHNRKLAPQRLFVLDHCDHNQARTGRGPPSRDNLRKIFGGKRPSV